MQSLKTHSAQTTLQRAVSRAFTQAHVSGSNTPITLSTWQRCLPETREKVREGAWNKSVYI